MAHLKNALIVAAVAYVVLFAAEQGMLPGIDLTKIKAKSA